MTGMALLATVRKWFTILGDPKGAYSTLQQRSFEEVLSEYLTLLIAVSAATGVVYFLNVFAHAAYYNLVLQADVNYWRLANYAFGGLTAVLLFFFFAGTFLAFFVSLFLRPFYKVKYTTLLACMCYALAPLLLFGWIYVAAPALLIWSAVLFAAGMKQIMPAKIKKGTLQDRQ